MARIVSTPQATSDLLDIWDYVEARSGEAAAHAMIRKIEQKLEALASQPMIGRPRDELCPDLRSFPVSPYLILYHSLPDGIAVVRVVHGRRDIYSIFNEEDELP